MNRMEKIVYDLRTFLYLVLVLCSRPGLFAQAPTESCLLWEVSGNGLTAPSYVFGTIHLIPKKDFVMDASVKKAFENCKTLALEADLNMDKETRDKLAVSTLLPDNKTMEAFMSVADFDFLTAYVKDTLQVSSIKWMLFKRVRPFFLSSLLMKEISGKTESYEERFMDMAKKRDMPLIGLESVLYQLSIIDSIPVERQVTMMLQGFRSGKDIRKEWQELVQIYKNKDLPGMQKLMIEEGNDIPDFEERFLNRRNRNWIPVMENLMQKNPTFVAVGAAHLMGPNGVISLLRQKGYTVSPVH
jgi:uncharacterized protein YbaP (TraB family)